MNLKVGILGSGPVARALGSGFIKHGCEVMIGTRNPSKVEEWRTASDGQVGTFEQAAAFGEIVVLAVKGTVAIELVEALAGELDGKVVIDTTNPIRETPPTHGVLSFFTDLNESLMERLQRTVPGARFVKAFNSVGNKYMVDPTFSEGKPTMFICADNEEAKARVARILEEFGWDVSDMGKAVGARAIEPLCMLWCIPGILRNEWTHAFKLIKG